MKTLEELNLVDDFLVNSLTSHKIYGEQSARYILECILHRQIGKLTVVPQRFFCGENLETHGIRLDVYLDHCRYPGCQCRKHFHDSGGNHGKR